MYPPSWVECIGSRDTAGVGWWHDWDRGQHGEQRVQGRALKNEIQETLPAGGTGCEKLQATASWRQGDSSNKSFKLARRAGERGPQDLTVSGSSSFALRQRGWKVV